MKSWIGSVLVPRVPHDDDCKRSTLDFLEALQRIAQQGDWAVSYHARRERLNNTYYRVFELFPFIPMFLDRYSMERFYGHEIWLLVEEIVAVVRANACLSYSVEDVRALKAVAEQAVEQGADAEWTLSTQFPVLVLHDAFLHFPAFIDRVLNESSESRRRRCRSNAPYAVACTRFTYPWEKVGEMTRPDMFFGYGEHELARILCNISCAGDEATHTSSFFRRLIGCWAHTDSEKVEALFLETFRYLGELLERLKKDILTNKMRRHYHQP